MERIRYRKTGEHTLESMQVLGHATNGARYRVRLNLANENQWLVVDAETDLVAASGFAKNRAAAQKSARKALSELGISVDMGRRNRTKDIAA